MPFAISTRQSRTASTVRSPCWRTTPGHRPREHSGVGPDTGCGSVNYRILYTVADDVLLVVVVTLGHRRDVYDR